MAFKKAFFARKCGFKGNHIFTMDLIQGTVGSLEFKSGK